MTHFFYRFPIMKKFLAQTKRKYITFICKHGLLGLRPWRRLSWSPSRRVIFLYKQTRPYTHPIVPVRPSCYWNLEQTLHGLVLCFSDIIGSWCCNACLSHHIIDSVFLWFRFTVRGRVFALNTDAKGVKNTVNIEIVVSFFLYVFIYFIYLQMYLKYN